MSRQYRKIDSKRMAIVRTLFVDRNWNRKFPNTRYDFDLYGGIANRSVRAKHARQDARDGLSSRAKYFVACARTEYVLSHLLIAHHLIAISTTSNRNHSSMTPRIDPAARKRVK